MELLPDNFCPQVMDLPQASQAFPPLPSKPAMKRKKKGPQEKVDTSRHKGQQQNEDKGKNPIMARHTEGKMTQREEKIISPNEEEDKDEGT